MPLEKLSKDLEVLDSMLFILFIKNINNFVQNKYSFNKSTCGIGEKIGISYGL